MTYVWASLCLLTWACYAAHRVRLWRIERKALTAYGTLLNVKVGRWETNRAARAHMVEVIESIHKPSREARVRWARAMTQRPEDMPN